MNWLTEILYNLFLAFFNPSKLPPIDTPMEPEPTMPSDPTPAMTNRELLYEESKKYRGIHIALDPTVDSRLGCATALSYVIQKVKWTAIPKQGINGTAGLLEWFESHPDLYQEVRQPLFGDIIISATGTGSGRVRGHCGIMGKHCVMSNNSQSGNWDEHWDAQSWTEYYERYGGIPTRYFRLK